MELYDEIGRLIDLHQEGSYWDFKKEWYGKDKDSDQLIDIICMANNLANRDAYIIIGIDEEQDYSVSDVSNDPNRRNTQMLTDFLRSKKFAGDYRPVVTVTHNIFYTAITRSKQHLKIFWSPETMQNVISHFETMNIRNDANIFSAQSKIKMHRW